MHQKQQVRRVGSIFSGVENKPREIFEVSREERKYEKRQWSPVQCGCVHPSISALAGTTQRHCLKCKSKGHVCNYQFCLCLLRHPYFEEATPRFSVTLIPWPEELER